MRFMEKKTSFHYETLKTTERALVRVEAAQEWWGGILFHDDDHNGGMVTHTGHSAFSHAAQKDICTKQVHLQISKLCLLSSSLVFVFCDKRSGGSHKNLQNPQTWNRITKREVMSLSSLFHWWHNLQRVAPRDSRLKREPRWFCSAYIPMWTVHQNAMHFTNWLVSTTETKGNGPWKVRGSQKWVPRDHVSLWRSVSRDPSLGKSVVLFCISKFWCGSSSKS